MRLRPLLGLCAIASACAIPDIAIVSHLKDDAAAGSTGSSGKDGNGGSGASTSTGGTSQPGEGGTPEPGTGEGGAPVSGSGGTSGMSPGGSKGTGGDNPCPAGCAAGLKCDPPNHRCIIEGGPCDQPIDEDFLFCDDFENGGLRPELWTPTSGVNTASEHGGSTYGLDLGSAGSVTPALKELQEYGFPIRISFWMVVAVKADFDTFFQLMPIKNAPYPYYDHVFGAYNKYYAWRGNDQILPPVAMSQMVQTGNWGCVEIYLPDAKQLKTTITLTGGGKIDLPYIQSSDFGAGLPDYEGPIKLGPSTAAGQKLWFDDFMVSRDTRSVCGDPKL